MLYLFFKTDSIKKDGLLTQWIKKNNFIPVNLETLSYVEFMKKCNRLAQSNNSGIFIDYPISDAFDLKTVETFVNHVKENQGQWFYSPRPNNHLHVNEVAFIGMNPITTTPKLVLFKSLLRNLAHRIASNDVLPSFFRFKAKRFITKIYHRYFQNDIYLDKASTTHNKIPQIKIPEQLRELGENWQSWFPDEDVLQRDLLERTELLFPHPQSIHVVLLNKCNLKCIMCPYHSPRYSPYHKSQYFNDVRIMKKDIFKKIADYAGKYRINLQFGQIEEPLMHKEIFTFFELAKKSGVGNIHMTTNGTLLDSVSAKLLGNSGIDSVMFSLDASSPENYRQIRGKDLDVVEENIKTFLPIAKQQNIYVAVSFILQTQTRHERERFIDKWHKIGVDAVTFYVLSEHELETGKMVRSEELYHKGKRYPCALPWTQSVVFPDGEVSLCCKTLTDVGWKGILSVGNLHEQTFKEIWSGEKYRTVRRELLNNDFKEFSVCSDCPIWSASTSLKERYADYIRIYNETMETITFI